MEKPSVGIFYEERKEPPAYSKMVSFERGIWKKFDPKFEFQHVPANEIVKTSYKEKEIFYTRYRVFSLAD